MQVFFNRQKGIDRIRELMNLDPVYEEQTEEDKQKKRRKRPVHDVIYIRGLMKEYTYSKILKIVRYAKYADATDYDKRPRDLRRGSYRYLIGTGAGCYLINIKTTKGRVIEIYDPDNICKKAETEEEAAGIIEAATTMVGGKYKSTASSYARALFKQQKKSGMFGDDRKHGLTMYDDQVTVDDYTRAALHGGWCYCKPGVGVIDAEGTRYDKNSLYPYWLAKEIPYNRQVFEYTDEADFDRDRMNPDWLFYVHFMASYKLKPYHLPFVTRTFEFGGKETNSRSSAYTIPEWTQTLKTIENGKEVCNFVEHPARTKDEPVEFVMTLPEWYLFFEQYDVTNYTFLDAIAFWKTSCAWYVDPLYKMKQESTGAGRQAVKIFLNGMIGSFQRRAFCEDIKFDENGDAHSEVHELTDKSMVSVGAWIVSCSMVQIVRDAQKNYLHFLYSDTDSIHLTGNGHDLRVSDKLGDYKIEAHWNHAVFYGQKQYIEWKDGGDIKVTFSGCPADTAKAIGDAILGKVTGFNWRGLTGATSVLPYDYRDNVEELWTRSIYRLKKGRDAVIPIIDNQNRVGLYAIACEIKLKENTQHVMFDFIKKKIENYRAAEYIEDKELIDKRRWARCCKYYRIPFSWWKWMKPERYLTEEEKPARLARYGTLKSPVMDFGFNDETNAEAQTRSVFDTWQMRQEWKQEQAV